MEMTNEEICRDFRQAKHKADQIQILSELNQCNPDEIVRILKEGGIQIGSRTKKFLKDEKLLSGERLFVSLPVQKTSVPADWRESLKILTERITELKQQRNAIEKELSDIYQALGDLCGKE